MYDAAAGWTCPDSVDGIVFGIPLPQTDESDKPPLLSICYKNIPSMTRESWHGSIGSTHKQHLEKNRSYSRKVMIANCLFNK